MKLTKYQKRDNYSKSTFSISSQQDLENVMKILLSQGFKHDVDFSSHMRIMFESPCENMLICFRLEKKEAVLMHFAADFEE